jgi:hypothetical protein
MLWNHLAVDYQPSKANHKRRRRVCCNIAATVWIYFDFIMTLPRLGSLRLKKGGWVSRASCQAFFWTRPMFPPSRTSRVNFCPHQPLPSLSNLYFTTPIHEQLLRSLWGSPYAKSTYFLPLSFNFGRSISTANPLAPASNIKQISLYPRQCLHVSNHRRKTP